MFHIVGTEMDWEETALSAEFTFRKSFLNRYLRRVVRPAALTGSSLSLGFVLSLLSPSSADNPNKKGR